MFFIVRFDKFLEGFSSLDFIYLFFIRLYLFYVFWTAGQGKYENFDKFSKHLIEKGVEFIIEPYIRFKGLAGEQATMFFKDPAGNALEFKSFKDFNQIFEK